MKSVRDWLPPAHVPVVGKDGKMNPVWYRYMTENANTLGGVQGPTLAEIQESVTAVQTAANQPQELDIDGGGITINAAFQKHRLTLAQNVTGVSFANVPTAATLTIEIEQWGGSKTIAFPANVSPVSGVPYVPTPQIGSVDLVTLQTTNGGVTWYLSVTQSPGMGVSLAPSPATASIAYAGTPNAPSVVVTATVNGGTGPFTYAWARDDAGGTSFQISSATASNPTFDIPSGDTAFNTTQRWRCTVTDSASKVAQATVNITLTRTMAAGVTVTLTPIFDNAYVINPDTPEVLVTTAVSGGTGPYTENWSRIDAYGGTDFTIGFVSANTDRFTSSGHYYYREQTWRFTATDSTGATAYADVVITLERA
ncbi:hypothetical protein V3390_09180 [Luteimonas sp. FXH3W]|uniref:Ig-like domain-containing protein n=1 Tax=Aquilutibacter rugosus TaxID=3115820 RepID=A0ABU7V0X1_9GAMM